MNEEVGLELNRKKSKMKKRVAFSRENMEKI